MSSTFAKYIRLPLDLENRGKIEANDRIQLKSYFEISLFGIWNINKLQHTGDTVHNEWNLIIIRQ